MERDKPKVGVTTFDITDTVLLEIDARLAEMAGADMGESTGFDMDFGAALDQDDSAASPANKRRTGP